MPERIPQSIAKTVVFRAFLSSTGALATGKTIAITISKGGATSFSNPSAGATNATEMASGFYKFTLSTTDTGTAGPLSWRGAEGTINDAGDCYEVVSAHNAGYDGIPNVAIGSTGALPVWVASSPSAGQVVQDANGRLNVNLDAVDSVPVYAFSGIIAGIDSSTVTYPASDSGSESIPLDDQYGEWKLLWFPVENKFVRTGAVTVSGTLQYDKVYGDVTGITPGVSGYVILGDWRANVTHVQGTAQTAGDLAALQTDIQGRIPASLTVAGLIKADTLRVGGTLQTAGDVAALLAAIQADLPQRITKNTALANFPFHMVRSTDHVTDATGLTVTATRRLDNGSFAACANAVTEVANGWYTIDIAATDTNANTIALRFTATGADSRNLTLLTQPT